MAHRASSRFLTAAARLLTVPAALVLGLALSPAAAHADTYRTASSTGSGPTTYSGQTNAANNARAALNSQARAAGEVCPSVTTTTQLVYTAPDGSAYVYNATASGWCTPAAAPPYVVPRSATAQGGGSSSQAAQSNGAAAAQAAVLAAGVACSGWQYSYAVVYIAPGGAWYIYDVTASALCTN
ncbi:hypothetical protein ABGB17_18160 [Sphaerisporangium sp. B11E5]|uniref:hypothetical protein n=1 Tax=Sphaerisporangium sp. B11E5 TaxID=3153563 RepID=UPI00325CBF5A